MLQDGSVLIGGTGVRRVAPDGNLDVRFQCQPRGSVYAMAQLSNGTVMIGGDFTQVNRLPRKFLARIFLSEQTPEPLLLGPYFSDGKFDLYLPTIRGRNYILESSSDLGSSDWAVVGQLPGNGNWNSIGDPVTAEGRRFYRVRVEK